MPKQKGLTLVEGLVVGAILALVLFFCVLALYGCRKDARDLKRVSDMEVMRSALTAIKLQSGSYASSGCELGAVYSCQSTMLATILPTIAQFRDPLGGNLCSQDCSSSCEYSFVNISESGFELDFYLEKGIGNYPDQGCYALTETGIIKK